MRRGCGAKLTSLCLSSASLYLLACFLLAVPALTETKRGAGLHVSDKTIRSLARAGCGAQLRTLNLWSAPLLFLNCFRVSSPKMRGAGNLPSSNNFAEALGLPQKFRHEKPQVVYNAWCECGCPSPEKPPRKRRKRWKNGEEGERRRRREKGEGGEKKEKRERERRRRRCEYRLSLSPATSP